LEGVLRIILHLDPCLIFLEFFAGAKGTGHSLLPLFLPALGIALQRIAVAQRLADCENISMATLAVVPHFRFTRTSWARLARVTELLASVRTVITRLHASLTAALFHQLLDGCEALALLMADSLANMAASQRNATLLPTVWGPGMTIYLRKCLFAAKAGLGNWLQAGWAVTEVTFEIAVVTTGQDFLAGASTSGLDSSASNGRI
jgi:hypothetical protein